MTTCAIVEQRGEDDSGKVGDDLAVREHAVAGSPHDAGVVAAQDQDTTAFQSRCSGVRDDFVR